MLNCKQATEIASNTLDRNLGLAERIGLRMHLLLCVHCRRYLRQISFIHRAAKNIDDQIESRLDLKLADERKKQIRKQLNPD